MAADVMTSYSTPHKDCWQVIDTRDDFTASGFCVCCHSPAELSDCPVLRSGGQAKLISLTSPYINFRSSYHS